MSPYRTTRRAVLGAGLGAAFLGGAAFAADAPDRKLVLVIARGGLDGLSLAPPIGDPAYAGLRGGLAIPAEAALHLDETFALHPVLTTVHQLAGAGQARIAPAIALPQHLRSHFDAQDLLESGGPALHRVSTGWLNRALQLRSASPLKGLSVGPQTPFVLRGPAQAQSWSPGAGVPDAADRLVGVLQDLYVEDALLGPALAAGLATEAMADALAEGAPAKPADVRGFAATAGRFLAAEGGPQIGVLSLSGFDTHARQGAAAGQLAQRLTALDGLVAGLKEGLGGTWNRSLVLLATEFGRTARVNGTGGTDHGTASTLLAMGGALRRGGLIGDWPGLAENRLFEGRDLAPSLDMRAVFKAALVDHLGLDRRDVETSVFPSSQAAPATQGLVA